MASKPKPTPKLCGRCDSFFPSIASDTCPQCFAPLTPLTEDEAIRAAEYQIARLKDPDYLEAKAAEDERFKEQSFGACLGVFAIFIVCIFVAGILIDAAKHTRPQRSSSSIIEASRSHDPTAVLLPISLGNLNRGPITSIPVSTSVGAVQQTTYGEHIQVFLLRTTGAQSQSLDSLHTIVFAICHQTNPPLISQEIHRQSGYYDIIGSNGGLVGDVSQRLINATHN